MDAHIITIVGGAATTLLAIVAAAFGFGKWTARGDSHREVIDATVNALKDGFSSLTEELKGFREFTIEMREQRSDWNAWRATSDGRLDDHDEMFKAQARRNHDFRTSLTALDLSNALVHQHLGLDRRVSGVPDRRDDHE